MSDLKELLNRYSNDVRIATKHDRVYKDECVYSYDTPESENGLFVCLKTFIGVSRDNIERHYRKTSSHLYLNIKTFRREVVTDNTSDSEPEKKRPTKFGIGIDGGFNLNEKQFYFENTYSLLVWPENQVVQLPDNGDLLNEHLKCTIDSVIQAESITYKEELESQVKGWDGEQRFVSKHSQTLKQDANPKQVPPTGWKCEKCDKTENLWLNLTDGSILCGRKQLDGSGGNNHAIDHYQQTKNPLAVKLGTITSDGKADVYSYDEDDMVEDTNLAVHLAHFGINIRNMEKTEKTMAELEIDLNQKIGEWDVIQEAGYKLQPIYGPGYTGMRNLGNSCYMNSIMQMLFTLPEFQRKYYDNYDKYTNSAPSNTSDDFNAQLSKLAYGLLSGRYSKEPVTADEQHDNINRKGIKPQSFKTLIGKGHPEFSTKRQQDAQEFLAYLFTLIERNCRTNRDSADPTNGFKFQLEDRIECLQTKHVKYAKRAESCLQLPVPVDAAVNLDEVREYKKRKQEAEQSGKRLDPNDLCRPRIPFSECLKAFVKDELVNDFLSSETGQRGNALKRQLFATFPDYLVVQMRKFELAADWTPIKLDVEIEIPDKLDLNEYRSTGLRQNEVELRENIGASAAVAEVQLNEGLVSQLCDMGFSLEGSKRAVYNTRDTNDAEAAVNWAVTHMEDADFNMPFVIPGSQAVKKPEATATPVSEESIEQIQSWGFTRAQAIKALKETNNNLERAADWIFSHGDDLMNLDNEPSQVDSGASASTSQPATTTTGEFKDGNGTYELVAFVSHMGTNANVGHYVVHIKKDGRWCIFNDQNVALSENPHTELAYLYLYRRI